MIWHVNKQRLCEVSHFKQRVLDQIGRSEKEMLMRIQLRTVFHRGHAVGKAKICLCEGKTAGVGL